MTTEEIQARIKELLSPGDTVYAIIRHVSRSGMKRVIEFMVIADNKPLYITGAIGALLGLKHDKVYSGLVVEGCGMDMVFSVVYDLGSVCYPEGFKPAPGYSRNGACQDWELDGGYAYKVTTL